MSSQRGNTKRTRAQKYQNKHAFKNDLHDKSKKMQMIKSLETWGLCNTCKEIIDWKIKYKKYKPLTQPKTCTKCSQKTVKRAYYTVCQPCSEAANVCGKCGKAKELVSKIGLSESEEMAQSARLEQELKFLSERERRAFIRNQESGKFFESDDKATNSTACDDDDSDDCDEKLNTDCQATGKQESASEDNGDASDEHSDEDPHDTIGEKEILEKVDNLAV